MGINLIFLKEGYTLYLIRVECKYRKNKNRRFNRSLFIFNQSGM